MGIHEFFKQLIKKTFTMKTRLIFLFFLMSSWLNIAASIETDHALFLFDNGEKNMVSSMLTYAQQYDPERLKNLNFRIVFFGASLDALSQEPFCNYPDKVIHYKDLNVEETIDRNWPREKTISQVSLNSIFNNLKVKKSVWVAVSCSPFEQILETYQKESVPIFALRDSPFPNGSHSYFSIAKQIQEKADVEVIPSPLCTHVLKEKPAILVGHPPTEEWQQEALQLNKASILERLQLDPSRPILAFTGAFGESYEKSFRKFLEILQDEALAPFNLQVLIVPHPRFKGRIEKSICLDFAPHTSFFRIVGEFEEKSSHKIKTVEALAISDLVLTADATSTIVIQANALRKSVLYIQTKPSDIADALSQSKVLFPIDSAKDLIIKIRGILSGEEASKPDIFKLMEMPKNGAKHLWEAFSS